MMIPLPIPTDPVSLGVSLATSFITGLLGLGTPSVEERMKAMQDMCTDPAKFRPDICGPFVWGSVNCPLGPAAEFNEKGAPIRCKCPIAALWLGPKVTGCGVQQTMKDNWIVLAAAGGLLLIVVLK